MPCSQSWAFTLQFRSRCITDDDHARCYVPWYREKRSCTLVWLGIEFIPLQTSEYIQWTTKTYILKKFWKVLEPSAQHQLDIPTLGKFGSLWAPGKRVRAKVGVPILCQGVTIFRCTLSPARTHTARCSSTPQEIMETELLETLSPPNICPQWWKRIAKIDSRHEDRYFCGGKLSTTSPISSRRLHLSNKPITGSVASVCILLGTGCYFLPIAWRTTTWKKWATERNISIYVRHDEWTEHLATSFLQYWSHSMYNFCLKPCLLSQIKPESQQLFWDYSLAISFILSISCPIPPYEHPFARCLLSDFLLPYTERLDVFNENNYMLIVLWWTDTRHVQAPTSFYRILHSTDTTILPLPPIVSSDTTILADSSSIWCHLLPGATNHQGM